jgi:hypothetical protein
MVLARPLDSKRYTHHAEPQGAYLERSRRPSTFPTPMPKYKETVPEPTGKRGALGYRIWKSFERLRKPEIKFAVKVGVGAVLLVLPAFTERWRDLYTHWRGEWALLTYFVVIAMNVGATTSTGLWRYIRFAIADFRILGTSIGAIAAITLFLLFLPWLIVDGRYHLQIHMFCRLLAPFSQLHVSISSPTPRIGNPLDDLFS